MAQQSKREQQAVRNILLKDGTVRASTAPSEFKSQDKKASMLNAIAARQLELRANGRS
jgi:hypothetical protein